MVWTALTIEREIEDAQSTRDTSASVKRKESQSSSSSGKKRRASSSQGFQSHDHPGQGRIRVASQSQGAIQAPSAARMGQRDQSVGRGQVQSSQVRMSRTQGRLYAIVPEAEHTD